MIKSDYWITMQSTVCPKHPLAGSFEPLIDPFIPHQVTEVDGKRVISYGLSSYGYDFRVGYEFKVFTNTHYGHIDPKAPDERMMTSISAQEGAIFIPPNSFALGYSLERFCLPRRVTALFLGKSTLARCGIIVNLTPGESTWAGHLTIEISNSTPVPVKVYAGEGIAQAIFFEADEDCVVSYADRKGKYQDQLAEVTLPRMK